MLATKAERTGETALPTKAERTGDAALATNARLVAKGVLAMVTVRATKHGQRLSSPDDNVVTKCLLLLYLAGPGYHKAEPGGWPEPDDFGNARCRPMHDFHDQGG